MQSLNRPNATTLFDTVRDFIRSHDLPEDAIVNWLENNGGHCDCEALANAEQVVEEAVPGYGQLAPSTNPTE